MGLGIVEGLHRLQAVKIGLQCSNQKKLMPDTVCHQLLHFSIVMTDLNQQSLKERSKRILQSINSSVNRSVSDEVITMYDELRLIPVDSKMYGKKFFGGIDFQH